MSDSLLESTEAQQEATAAPSVEENSAPQELLLGKYKSPDDLAKAYKELESKLGSKEEDLRSKILEELQSEAFKDRPSSAGDYQLPDIVDSDSGVDNELLQWWAEHSYENGYSQEEFAKGIEMYAKAVMGSQPDLEAETKKLGDNSSQRIEAANLFANKFFPKEVLPAIGRMCESAEGIMALEVIMEAMKDGSFAGEATPASGLSQADLNEMMRDPRYGLGNPAARDADFVKKVNDGFKQLYG